MRRVTGMWGVVWGSRGAILTLLSLATFIHTELWLLKVAVDW